MMLERSITLFKALADETRQRLLEFLSEKEIKVGDIVKAFQPMSQPTISHHLKILKNAQLVRATKRGKEVWYSADWHSLEECMKEFLSGLISRFKKR